jgi:hypothetical protein
MEAGILRKTSVSHLISPKKNIKKNRYGMGKRGEGQSIHLHKPNKFIVQKTETKYYYIPI